MNQRIRLCFAHRFIFQVVVALFLLSTVVVARGQGSLQNASVFGSVTDASGAMMPGVTVTVTSPALQGTQTIKTGDDGSYRITQLPPGVYAVTFSQSAFQQEVRQNLNLSSGFNARVDVAMKLGTTTQSVEVTGAAPVIDTASTSALGEVEQVTMEQVPSTRAITDAVYLAAGVRPSGTPDIGGSDLGAQQSVGAYGFAANITTLIEGVDVMQQSGGEIGGPTGSGLGQLPDYDSIADLTVITTGGQADIGEAGPVVIVTIKSGSNNFHGEAHAFYTPHGFQLTNLPSNGPGLGAGGNQLQYFVDAAGDLGGRIIKDRLWFWGGYHLERNSAAVYQLPGPDGTGQGYNPTSQDDTEAKVTYQAAKKVRFVGNYGFNSKFNPEYINYQTAASGYEPSYHYLVGFWNLKGEVIWTPSPKWVVDVLGGYKWQYYSYPNQAGVSVAGNPYTYDQNTGITSGADFNISQFDNGSHDRIVYSGTASYFPSGKHQFTFGEQLFLPDKHIGAFTDHPSGNYELITKSGVPYQLITFNFPFKAEGKENAIGTFVKDQWRATKRLTVNFGGRFDYYKVYNDATKAPAGQFSLGATYPALTVNTFMRAVPRVGVAYDVTGNGKNVIRASYGMYNIPFVGEFDLVAFNPASLTQTTYDWSQDTCQVTAYTKCAPSSAFLNAITSNLATPSKASLNGGASSIYVTTSSASLGQPNPNLRLPFLHQASVQFEREIAPNIAARAIYVYSLEEDMYGQVFPNRPITAYTVPFTTSYPGSDPVNHNNPLTIYTYPNTSPDGTVNYLTANQYKFENRNGNPDFYNAIGFSVTKHQVNHWGAGISADFIKDHRSLNSANVFAASNGFGQNAADPVAPYQKAFPLDQTWDYTLKSYITTRLPYQISFGVNYEFLAGTPNYATDQITGVPNLGTVTIPVNKFGSVRTPDLNVLNVKIGRVFHIKEHITVEGTTELFNALNAAPAESVNYINGAAGTTKAFGYVNTVMPPFIGRFGGVIRF